MTTAKQWRKFFEGRGLQKSVVDSYIQYVERLLKAQLPVIFEFEHLASLLGRTPEYLASVVNAPEKHYRTFQIPKRRGGHRPISAPYPALLECQQWINVNILSKCSAHSAAHGFISTRSIISNASVHLNKQCLLKMDLKDFFTSIPLRRVMYIFRTIGYPRNVSFYLASLCCLNRVLPQGAATSPSLSNLIVLKLDSRLTGLAKSYELDYTRYADDLVFSGQDITVSFSKLVEDIALDEGFAINPEKTILSRSRGKRIVTGLSVTGAELKLPREYKRQLRKEVHYILRFGYFSHVSEMKIKDPFYIDSIYGKLAFWKTIEPDNAFVNESLPRIAKLMEDLS